MDIHSPSTSKIESVVETSPSLVSRNVLSLKDRGISMTHSRRISNDFTLSVSDWSISAMLRSRTHEFCYPVDIRRSMPYDTFLPFISPTNCHTTVGLLPVQCVANALGLLSFGNFDSFQLGPPVHCVSLPSFSSNRRLRSSPSTYVHVTLTCNKYALSLSEILRMLCDPMRQPSLR